jgi:hypothetical protein
VERVLLAAALTAVVVVVALAARRRWRATGVSAPGEQGWSLPQQLARADFPRPDAPWLVAVFWSATCDTCHGVLAAAHHVEDRGVVVADVEYGAQPELHRRYGIEAVPAVAVADATGGVHRWLLGPGGADGIEAALAEARGAPATPGTGVAWPRRPDRAEEPE